MIDKAEKWYNDKLPFVIYRKPHEANCFGWFQTNDFLHTVEALTESCFVFAPFSGNKKVVFYPNDCDIIQEKLSQKVTFSEENYPLTDENIVKNSHVELVKKGIQAINENKMTKVVLSRQEQISIEEKLLTVYFRRFEKKYPTAFVYWFYHPKVGMWMGASPEQLTQISGNTIKTVALAATQTDEGLPLEEVIWGEKEQEEQKVVTDFILSALQPFTEKIQQSANYTHKAGTLLHIKTDIEAELSHEKLAFDAVKALHPTPALCGFPKEISRKFIIANEGYDREYYGGFLGEWKHSAGNPSNKSDLFVNLRCMKIIKDKAYLFLGGGVNKDSNPAHEYLETVNKSRTVKSIL